MTMATVIEIRLREILKERGIKQKQLAAMTGLTERTISELASGKMKRLPKEAIEKIADVLQLNDINEIMRFKKEDA